MWRIEYKKSAVRSLRNMPRNIADTIGKKIAVLAADPYAPNNNVTKLQGREGYRLRVGDWRVLYELEDAQLVILDVKSRGGAYQ